LSKKLLIIGFVWPEPKSSAAGSRMLQLISFFQSQGYIIIFASTCAKSDNAFDLSEIGVKKVTIQLNHSSFDDFIIKLKPDIVLFDRFMTEEQFGWRVSEHCPEAIKLLDTEDLHFLRRARQDAFKTESEVTNVNVYNETTKREIASIYRCDLSLIISKAEISLLKNKFQIHDTLLCYLPFLVEDLSEADIKQMPSFNDRHHFVTIGNFLHEPNYNALLYLKETLWKTIRQQLPYAELHNYKGFADDVNDVMRDAKVLLAPIRYGAGLKGKLFDAMLNGTPFVSTSIGVEGIIDNDQDFICDTPEDFIKHSVKLYQDDTVWNAQQALGFKVLKAKFSKPEFETNFSKRLDHLSENLKSHRQQNFIGQLLQHHTMQSTKYMSKWIEAKNT